MCTHPPRWPLAGTQDHFCPRLTAAGAGDHAQAYGRQDAARMAFEVGPDPKLPPASHRADCRQPGEEVEWRM